MNEESHHDSRLTKVERDLEAFAPAINELTQGMAAVNVNLNHLNNSIKTLFSDRKVPGSTVISSILLVITILSLAMVPIYFRISKVEEKVQKQNQKIIEQAEINGYEKALHEILLRK